jgi:bacterial leucyl aminopeptidase
MVQLIRLVTVLGLSTVLVAASLISPVTDNQAVLTLAGDTTGTETEASIANFIANFTDPVEALIALRPGQEAQIRTSRLLHVLGDATARWMTEGDKLRLRRQRRKFIDITDHHEYYESQASSFTAGKARALLTIPCTNLLHLASNN